jgi:hypothetical protein
MTLRDRTNEFCNIAESIKVKKTPNTTRSKAPQGKSPFSHVANQIGKDIASTADKLQRLTKLAKPSPFSMTQR